MRFRLLAGSARILAAAVVLLVGSTAFAQVPAGASDAPVPSPGAVVPAEPAEPEPRPEPEPADDPEPEADEAEDDGGFGFGGEEGPTFKVNGYIQSQFGIFVSPDKEETVPAGDASYVSHHGGKLGQVSIFRNTLQLEADWQPAPPISVHAIFRGVRSLKLKADKDAQPPNPKKLVRRMDRSGLEIEEWVALGPDELREQVRNKYYDETDLRELYVDLDAAEWLNFRVGKQQVSWGETGQFRLLDVVNPINSTWHFGSLESFEDQRIPLWMLNTTIDIPPLQGNLQIVWIPMLNDPEDHVTVPLTFVGAWGLPPPVAVGGDPVKLQKYRRKVFLYPGNDIENSRAGFRWKGELGNFTYSLVYFYTHVISPPIPFAIRTPFGSNADIEIYSEFPRQHIAGLALETTLPNPVTMNVKFEAAFEPDRTYPVNGENDDRKRSPGGKDFDGSGNVVPKHLVYRGIELYEQDQLTLIDNPKKKVLSYALTLQRPTAIRWLNPEMTTMFVFQFMHTWITDFDLADTIVEIPGYDTTAVREHSFRLIGSIFTSYLHGMLTPRLLAVFALGKTPGRGDEKVYQGGFVSASLGMTLGNNWRAVLAVNQFFGPDPYDGVGLFRDRDEVNLLVRYQF